MFHILFYARNIIRIIHSKYIEWKLFFYYKQYEVYEIVLTIVSGSVAWPGEKDSQRRDLTVRQRGVDVRIITYNGLTSLYIRVVLATTFLTFDWSDAMSSAKFRRLD